MLVTAASKSSAKNCTAEGDGLKQAFVENESSFMIFTNDVYGNSRRRGGDTIALSDWQGTYTTQDLADGRYIVKTSPHLSGIQQVNALVNSEPIFGSPFPVTVQPGKTIA